MSLYIMRQRKILQHYQKPTQDEDESKEKFKKEKKTRRPNQNIQNSIALQRISYNIIFI